MTKPILYIFSGLPGSGKSTIAKQVAVAFGAIYLRVDTIEQALRDLCGFNVEGEGYGLAYRVAADNLRLGLSVVADSCNPIQWTRDEWEAVAGDTGANFANVEISCSNAAEHRRRIEERETEIPGLRTPSWDDVLQREYHDWTSDPIRIDTAGKPLSECVEDVISELAASLAARPSSAFLADGSPVAVRRGRPLREE